MAIEDAITTAIQFETRVRDVYNEAAAKAVDDAGRGILKLLADEENHHLEYLNHLLGRWKETGELGGEGLRTAIPSPEAVRKVAGRLQEHVSDRRDRPSLAGELEALHRALDVEIETGNFYERMVKELGDDGRKVFGRFLEIEQGHRAIVQAEIDHLSATGFYFDLAEFNVEAD